MDTAISNLLRTTTYKLHPPLIVIFCFFQIFIKISLDLRTQNSVPIAHCSCKVFLQVFWQLVQMYRRYRNNKKLCCCRLDIFLCKESSKKFGKRELQVFQGTYNSFQNISNLFVSLLGHKVYILLVISQFYCPPFCEVFFLVYIYTYLLGTVPIPLYLSVCHVLLSFFYPL